MFFVILIVIVVGSYIFSSIQANEERNRRNQKAEEQRKLLAEQKRIYESEFQSLVDNFGSCSACVSLRSNLIISSNLFVFEGSKMYCLAKNINSPIFSDFRWWMMLQVKL